MNKMVVIAAALAVAGVVPAPAAAQVTVRVAHADLRLDSGRDVARLDRRIGRAAETACGSTSDLDLHGRNEVARCRLDARAAVAQQRDRLVERARRTAAR